MRQCIATVTEDERNEIEQNWERLVSLNDLSATLASNNSLYLENSHFYNNIIADITIAKNNVSSWWKRISEKYSLDKDNLGKYFVDFTDGDIYLNP